MKKGVLFVAIAALALAAGTAEAGRSFGGGFRSGGGGFRSSPSRPPSSPYRTSPPTVTRPTYTPPPRQTVRPSLPAPAYRTYPPRVTSTYTPARRGSGPTSPGVRPPTSPYRPGRAYAYGGRQYTPVYNQNGMLQVIVWWMILNNGQRERHYIDCQHPQTTEDIRACQEARG